MLIALFLVAFAGAAIAALAAGSGSRIRRGFGWACFALGVAVTVFGLIGMATLPDRQALDRLAGRTPHPWYEAAVVVAIGIGLAVLGYVTSRPSRAPISPQGSDLDQLEQLGRLRDQGVLTPEEFESKKRGIIDQG